MTPISSLADEPKRSCHEIDFAAPTDLTPEAEISLQKTTFRPGEFHPPFLQVALLLLSAPKRRPARSGDVRKQESKQASPQLVSMTLRRKQANDVVARGYSFARLAVIKRATVFTTLRASFDANRRLLLQGRGGAPVFLLLVAVVSRGAHAAAVEAAAEKSLQAKNEGRK